jgi:cytochrome c biogenesis protein CcmG/thiol:disulfide interchange protein DsbE
VTRGARLCAAAWIALTTAAVSGPTPAADAPPVAATGDAAPLFDLPGLAANVRLERYRGKLVYLDFWASWCAPCKHSFPWMSMLQQQYGARGLQVIAVNLDARRADADTFLERTPAAFVVAFDPAGVSARQYHIKGMPSSALIGRDGRLLWLHTGFTDADRAGLEAQLQAALQ